MISDRFIGSERESSKVDIMAGIAAPKTNLRFGMSLLRGFAPPFDRFGIILCHPNALGVAHGDVILRYGISIVCRLAPPFDSRFLILGYTIAFPIAQTQS